MDNHVKKLMEAEARANQIVEKANEEKSARLEGARFEAKKEIAKYREEEERKFKEYIEKEWGNRNELKELEKETDKEIKDIERQYVQNKDKVIKLLLDNVMNVDLEIPKVVKGIFE